MVNRSYRKRVEENATFSTGRLARRARLFVMAAEPVVGRNNFPSPSPGASSSSTTLPCLDLQTKKKKKRGEEGNVR